jgi:polar amino acid transport system substrate-binding protein
VRAEGIPGSYDLFVAQKLDALSGLKPRLLMDVERLPGARILDGRFTAIQQGVGTPVARAAAARYLSAFVEEVKSSGLVAKAISRHGVRGVNVAPPAAA